MSQRTEQEIRDSLPLFALGLLEGEEAQSVQVHLETGCPECARELRDLREIAGDIPIAFQAVKPHPRVREKLLAKIAELSVEATPVKKSRSGAVQPIPGLFVIKKDAGEWRSTPWAGVTFKLLYVDRQTQYVTSLLKLEPGAKYPAHRHVGNEQCLVIEGDVRLGPVAVSQGDFEYAVAGTEHGVITTDNGCVLLIISHQHDEVFA